MKMKKGSGNQAPGSGTYACATALSTSANGLIHWGIGIRTYRTYIKPKEYGVLNLKIWHSNAADSTWSDGKQSTAGEPGGQWEILQAAFADGGSVPDGSIREKTSRAVTFNGRSSITVRESECFESDELSVELPEGHYLVFTWSIQLHSSGHGIPYNCESVLASTYRMNGNGVTECSSGLFEKVNNELVLPAYFGYKKTVRKRIAFLGDSITQGVSTAKDAYENWVAKIANGLGTAFSVWNIGSGWARAYDCGSTWLSKASQNDEVVICLGVNDIGTLNRNEQQIMADLSRIVSDLRSLKPDIRIILFTIPPFNFQGEQEKVWRKVNRFIRQQSIPGVDRIFDIASILRQSPPKEQCIKEEYQSSGVDFHPNGPAGADISKTFLSWYFSS